MIIRRRGSVTKSQRQKCLVIGDAMVGKTTLIKKLLGLPIPQRYEATVFLDFYTGRVLVPKSSEYLMLTFTDFSIETEMMRLPTESESQVIIVCYSIRDRESFDNVRTFWLPLIERYHTRNPVLIVATNVDSRDDSKNDHVTVKEGQLLAKQFGVEYTFEVSKYQSMGIRNIVEKLSSFSCWKQNRGEKDGKDLKRPSKR